MGHCSRCCSCRNHPNSTTYNGGLGQESSWLHDRSSCMETRYLLPPDLSYDRRQNRGGVVANTVFEDDLSAPDNRVSRNPLRHFTAAGSLRSFCGGAQPRSISLQRNPARTQLHAHRYIILQSKGRKYFESRPAASHFRQRAAINAVGRESSAECLHVCFFCELQDLLAQLPMQRQRHSERQHVGEYIGHHV